MFINKKGEKVQYRGGRSEKIYLKVRTSTLCELFECSPDTLRRWVRTGRLDPSSLIDIVNKANNPYMLDYRRSTPK